MSNVKVCICCRENKVTILDKGMNAPKCKNCFQAMGECKDCKMFEDCKETLSN